MTTFIGPVGRNIRATATRLRWAATLALSLALAAPTLAEKPDAGKSDAGNLKSKSPEAVIRQKLQRASPGMALDSLRPSPAPGLYELQLSPDQPMLYATPDGNFFVLGDLFAVEEGGVVNLSDQQRNIARKALMAGVSRDDMIVFSPERKTRGAIAVFTDVDCYYCQKLHREVPALNAAGIEVRYLAYPRAGVGSESYRKIASAWCSSNPREAITILKNLESIPDNVCSDNPVADQFMLGQRVGVRGTPAMVLEDGQMLPGYMTADDIVTRMGLKP